MSNLGKHPGEDEYMKIAELYINSGLRPDAIGAMLGIKASVVTNRLVTIGYPCRKISKDLRAGRSNEAVLSDIRAAAVAYVKSRHEALSSARKKKRGKNKIVNSPAGGFCGHGVEVGYVAVGFIESGTYGSIRLCRKCLQDAVAPEQLDIEDCIRNKLREVK